jgi:hypothetical protein
MAKEPSQAMLIAESVYFQTLGNQPLASRSPENAKKVAATAIMEGVAFETAWKQWEREADQLLSAKAAKDQADTQPAAQEEPERKPTKAKRAKRKPA